MAAKKVECLLVFIPPPDPVWRGVFERNNPVQTLAHAYAFARPSNGACMDAGVCIDAFVAEVEGPLVVSPRRRLTRHGELEDALSVGALILREFESANTEA
jgi:hypothetical protein